MVPTGSRKPGITLLLLLLSIILSPSCLVPSHETVPFRPEIDLIQQYDAFRWETEGHIIQSPTDDSILLDFAFQNDPAGWMSSGQIGFQHQQGRLLLEAPQETAFLLSPDHLGMDSENVVGIRLSMATNAPSVWVDYRRRGHSNFEGRKWRIYPPEADRLVGYFISTHDINRWSGLIDQFRVRLPPRSYLQLRKFQILSHKHFFPDRYGVISYPFPADVYQGCKILRKCIYVRGSNAFTLPEIKPNSRTVLSVCATRIRNTSPSALKISAIADGTEYVLLELPVLAQRDWPESRVSLASFAEQTIQLKFTSDLADDDVALWGCPKLYEAGKRPNIIFFLVDALRTDTLGCYNPTKRDLSPHIDAFARESTLFARCFAPSNWTRPSMSSIMTGLSVLAHGNIARGQKVPDLIATLPKVLQKKGWHTTAFLPNPQVVQSNLCEGFDTSYLLFAQKFGVGEEYMDAVNDWIAARGQRPFFLYVHTMDNHRAGYKIQGASNSHQLYERQTRITDELFGRLLKTLKATGQYDNTWIIFTSDHGEAFEEHGTVGHGGSNLYQETVHIPLLIHLKSEAFAKVIQQNVSGLDLFPTLLDYLHCEYDKSFVTGRSLLPLMRGEDDSSLKSRNILISQGTSHAIVKDHYKIIKHSETGRIELYDLEDDPGELDDLSARCPTVLAELTHTLDSLLRDQEQLFKVLDGRQRSISPPTEEPMDTDLLETLKALGYLDR